MGYRDSFFFQLVAEKIMDRDYYDYDDYFEAGLNYQYEYDYQSVSGSVHGIRNTTSYDEYE